MVNISYANLIIGLRAYIEEQTGVPTVWRYQGFKAPDNPFITVRYANSVFDYKTKLNDWVMENVYLHIGNYGKDVVQMAEAQAKINEILLYHTIPIRDSKGEVIADFNVSRITSAQESPHGTRVEDESEALTIYTDFAVEVNHVKKRI